MTNLDVWYAHADITELRAQFDSQLQARQRKYLDKGLAKARTRDSMQELAKLVTQAKQEGELDTATTTEQSPRVPQVKEAFNKMFGLNLNINVALGDQAGKLAKMITTLDAGTRVQVADTHAQGRLVSCLEGGYDLQALAESVQLHLEELLAHRAIGP